MALIIFIGIICRFDEELRGRKTTNCRGNLRTNGWCNSHGLKRKMKGKTAILIDIVAELQRKSVSVRFDRTVNYVFTKGWPLPFLCYRLGAPRQEAGRSPEYIKTSEKLHKCYCKLKTNEIVFRGRRGRYFHFHGLSTSKSFYFLNVSVAD